MRIVLAGIFVLTATIATVACNGQTKEQASSGGSAEAYYREMLRCRQAFKNAGKALGQTQNATYSNNEAWLMGMIAASGDIAGIDAQQVTQDMREVEEDQSLRPPSGQDFVQLETFVSEVCRRSGPKNIPIKG